MNRKFFLGFLLVSFILILGILLPGNAWAQTTPPRTKASPIASKAPEATTSASPDATPAASLEKAVTKKEDITAPTPELAGKLERYLAENPVGPLTVTNFLQHAIRKAVGQGVPANTIVLVLLFPIIVSLIVISRHWIGIRGFGIFLPAVLSVVFVTTGVVEGLLLFLLIIVGATASKPVIRRLRLQYLPRTALTLWFVTLCVLAALFVSPLLNLKTIMNISIFPILILILLVENFLDIQAGMSLKEAINMTMETLVIALICSLILNLDILHKFALLYPEITVVSVAALNIFMGKYVGLRLLEYRKFKELIK